MIPSSFLRALRGAAGHHRGGEGHNWWCVVFPTLCVPASSEGFQETAEASGLSGQLAETLTREGGRLRNSLPASGLAGADQKLAPFVTMLQMPRPWSATRICVKSR